jgi:hypothetical protein
MDIRNSYGADPRPHIDGTGAANTRYHIKQQSYSALIRLRFHSILHRARLAKGTLKSLTSIFGINSHLTLAG